MIRNLLRSTYERIRLDASTDFDTAEIINSMLNDGECAEEFGDELRLWCHRRCAGRCKQIGRGTPGMVRIAFESVLDAAMFRDSAIDDCRAVIAVSARRRHNIKSR